MKNNDEICTPFELKQFAFAGHSPTAFNLARFIESKSGFKYTVIEIEFLLDAFKALEEHIQFSSNLGKSFRKKWQDLDIPMTKLF
jgi:hypothetical protein